MCWGSCCSWGRAIFGGIILEGLVISFQGWIGLVEFSRNKI